MASVSDASELLRLLGLPPAQCNGMAGLTLLTLSGLTPKSAWNKATRKLLRVHDIKEAMAADWRKTYAENTRETIRRYVLHQFFEARVVDLNPEEPTLPTNSPRTRYALTPEALTCVRAWGGPEARVAIAAFQRKYGSLVERSRKDHGSNSVVVNIPDGPTLALSPGAHNEVQRSVVEKFLPRFVPGAKVLYLGDTAHKGIHLDKESLERLKLDVTEHGKLPDIVLLHEERGWLVLVEAVTSHGPVTPVREEQLRRLFDGHGFNLIFVTAFPDRTEFRRHLADIAWETEVWIADEPNHLVHFNGDKFLGAYAPTHD